MMRALTMGVFLGVLLPSLPAPACGEDSAPGARGEAAKPQFIIECRVIERDAKRKSHKILAEPTLVTIEHRPAYFKVGHEVPIVAGVRRETDYEASGLVPQVRPIHSVLEAGTTLTTRVSRDRPGYVTLDVNLSLATIESPKESTALDGEKRQSGRVRTEAIRAVECIELGKKLTLTLGREKTPDQVVEIVVTEAKPTKPQ
jgi:hypothetical protein